MGYQVKHFVEDLKAVSRQPWNLKENDIQISGGRLPFKDDGVGFPSQLFYVVFFPEDDSEPSDIIVGTTIGGLLDIMSGMGQRGGTGRILSAHKSAAKALAAAKKIWEGK